METKKHNIADLEKKRFVFLQIGLVFVLASLLAAFEWTTKIHHEPVTIAMLDLEYITELPPIQRIKDLRPPTPKIDKNKDSITQNLTIEINTRQEPLQKTEPKIAELDVPENYKKHIFCIDRTPAEFKGGIDSLKSYILRQINYPPELRGTGIQGKVFVRFVIDVHGKVKQAEIVRSINPLLDSQAIDIVLQMPTWKPATACGIPTETESIVPITFKPKG